MNVAVFGAGTMGHALALVFALGGHQVRLTDSHAATLARAPGLIEAARATLVEAGEANPDWTAEKIAGAITICHSVAETLEGCTLVVEAIVEVPEAKRALFAEIDALAGPDVVIASNTSYLDIFPLVPKARAAKTVIAHWYTPPYLVDLVDIVGSEATDPAVITLLRDTVAAMGKVPVVMKRFISGYIANRLQSAMQLEVQFLLDEGYATARDVDDAVIHGLALRMPIVGHCAKADFTGLKLLQHVLANRTYEPPVARGHSETLDRLVAEGRTGVVAGRGYFDWSGRTADELFRDRDRRMLALKSSLRAIGPMEGK